MFGAREIRIYCPQEAAQPGSDRKMENMLGKQVL